MIFFVIFVVGFVRGNMKKNFENHWNSLTKNVNYLDWFLDLL